jgi:hypothetical protein
MSSEIESACQIDMAERELAAFLHVVSELYGPEEANTSAQDWIDELELLDRIPAPTEREWRLLTIAAANRLAERINAQCVGTKLRHR